MNCIGTGSSYMPFLLPKKSHGIYSTSTDFSMLTIGIPLVNQTTWGENMEAVNIHLFIRVAKDSWYQELLLS